MHTPCANKSGLLSGLMVVMLPPAPADFSQCQRAVGTLIFSCSSQQVPIFHCQRFICTGCSRKPMAAATVLELLSLPVLTYQISLCFKSLEACAWALSAESSPGISRSWVAPGALFCMFPAVLCGGVHSEAPVAGLPVCGWQQAGL